MVRLLGLIERNVSVACKKSNNLTSMVSHRSQPTQHPRIMKAHEELLPWPQLQVQLEALSVAMRVNDVPAIRSTLQQLVQGYVPSGEVVDWVHLKRQAAFE